MRCCSLVDCDRPHYAQDLCRPHYDRKRWRGTTDAPAHLVQNRGRSCGVDGCDRPAEAKGYCNPHYKRLRKFGDPGAGGPIRVRRDQSAVPDGHGLCPGCDRVLPTEQFARNQRRCRDCGREYYQANTAQVLARNSASSRRSYERAKAEGRCTWRFGRGCQKPIEPGFVHCVGHRAADAARHSREFARHYTANGLTRCWLCTEPFTEADGLEHDHLIPKSLGGPDDPWNRAPAHRSCNNRRRNTPLAETVATWHPDGLIGPIGDLVEAAMRRFADGRSDARASDGLPPEQGSALLH